MTDDELLTTDQVSLITGHTAHTLRQFRYTGQGPAFIKQGRFVFYRACDVKEYVYRGVPAVGTEDDDLLTQEEVSRILGVSLTRLANWRFRKVGPKYCKPRNRVRYLRSDFEAYLEEQQNAPPPPVKAKVTKQAVVKKKVAKERNVRPQELLTIKEVSDLFGLSKDTLQHWRNTGQGPQYIEREEAIFYRAVTITNFLIRLKRAKRARK